MKRSLILPSCIAIVLLTIAARAPQALAAPAMLREETPVSSPSPSETPAAQAEPSATPLPEETEPLDVAARLKSNLMTDQPTLRLVSMGGAIYLYPEPATRSKRVKLVNTNTRGASEFIVLADVTANDGKLFYLVRSTFSGDRGYVLVRDTHESKLMKSGVSGYARIEAAACYLLSEPKEKSNVLAKESEHLLRILGEIDGYYYVITEGGNFGFVLPAQVVPIDESEVQARIRRLESPAVQEMMQDPLTEGSAANAAAMLRAGVDCAAVSYWNTAEAHVPQQGFLKKAAIAMLSCAAGSQQKPVGREGFQFQACPEVPPLSDGMQLQQGLDFNLHGSIYTSSPITRVHAELAPVDGTKAVQATVTFLPEQNITGYSLASKVEPVEGKSLDAIFDISRFRAGQYRFTLEASTVAQPEPVTLLSADCEIVDIKKHVLTQNKFDDNYLDASEFFGGNTDAFLFPYTIKDGRSIATDTVWREAHIVVSSLGRVHIDAVPNFEAANHYLETSYVRVSLYSQRTGQLKEGQILLLKDLVDKAVTYVPRFQSNLEYISHHTFGTAIDVNDNMYPNTNKRSHHELIGDDVKNHLVYNGIQTDPSGLKYYDFTYDGTYRANYRKVPKTIINYLLYELAFFRAGFEWGFYYETTCDAMHFMLTENDRNRHMHTDIGLRKVFDYAEPEWTYVPTATPAPSGTPAPVETIPLLIPETPTPKP